jgi:hypothetical protein
MTDIPDFDPKNCPACQLETPIERYKRRLREADKIVYAKAMWHEFRAEMTRDRVLRIAEWTLYLAGISILGYLLVAGIFAL